VWLPCSSPEGPEDCRTATKLYASATQRKRYDDTKDPRTIQYAETIPNFDISTDLTVENVLDATECEKSVEEASKAYGARRSWGGEVPSAEKNEFPPGCFVVSYDGDSDVWESGSGGRPAVIRYNPYLDSAEETIPLGPPNGQTGEIKREKARVVCRYRRTDVGQAKGLIDNGWA